MKHINKEIIYLIVTLLIAAMLPCLNLVYAQTTETYENSSLSFKFQYPSEWKANLLEVGDGVYFDINPMSQKDVGVNRTGLSVAVLPMHQSAHEWFREYLYEQKETDYSTLKTSGTKLGDFPATMATWDIKNDNIKRAKALSVFAVIDTTVYHIHYEVSPDLYDKFLSQVYKITNTFQII